MFVGRTPEAERVRVIELADREASELFVDDRPVELTLRTFVEAVKADDDERRQCSQGSLLVCSAILAVPTYVRRNSRCSIITCFDLCGP